MHKKMQKKVGVEELFMYQLYGQLQRVVATEVV